MTWRLVIFSSPVLALTLWLQAAAAGTVTGSAGLISKSNSQPADLSGIVVWLEPTGGYVPAPAPMHVRILQKNKTFSPHLLAVPVGSTVDFPNLDPIYHNAFSNFNGQIFDIGLYPPGKSRGVVFSKPGVVRVFCNIHSAMSAVIVVVDTPYFAVTNRAGRYVISNVPAGTYRRNVFHERATAEILKRLAGEVTIGSGETMLAPVNIPETGYIPVPHTNKYGREYPRDPAEGNYSVPQ